MGESVGNVHNRSHGEANLPWACRFSSDELGAYLACVGRSVRRLAQAFEPDLAPVNQFVLRTKAKIFAGPRDALEDDAWVLHRQQASVCFVDDGLHTSGHAELAAAISVHFDIEP